MELLYLWINHSKNGIFRHQGINLSPEFNFIVEKKEEKWVFSEDNSWNGRKSIFKNEIVENVSAIVGRNGVGKTTLLDYLIDLDCWVPPREAYGIDYEAMREKDIREALCIYVFREKDEICIYHNFENGFENKTDYNVKNMSNKKLYQESLLAQSDFNDILKIYITNSGCGSIQRKNISSQFKLDKIALTPEGISIIASSYFDKLLDLNATPDLHTIYYKWRKMLKSWLDADYFQKICDILYFNKLIKEKKLEGYAVNISTRLNISFGFAPKIVYKSNSQKLQKEQQSKLSEICDFVNVFRQKMDDNLDHIIKNLISNLIFEICLDSEIDFFEITLNKTEYLEWAKSKIIFTSNKEYFMAAVSEIEELTEILEKATVKKNVVPPSDLAYDHSLVFDYDKDPEAYNAFLNFIEKRFTAKHSLVMRYAMIENIGMSSGERAFQNFFSWINLLPQFHSIDSSVPKKMRSTILLLIDEMDLYLHPEWQKNFISILLDEVKNQFSGYKVQIIFATHSPLCLSDVPNENIVYLSGGEGHAMVDDRRKHTQTFGKDVYSLLNDAFYLENSTMGLFAQKYIDNIIQQMLDKDNNEYRILSLNKIEKMQEKIQCIGNEILKNKLLSMLRNCYADKNDELEMLRKQQEMIGRRIAELEV